MKKIIFLTILVLVALGWFGFAVFSTVFNNDSEDEIPDVPTDKSEEWSAEVISANLDIPWDLALLPDGNLLLTERPGTIKRVDIESGEISVIASLQNVYHFGEGGLMGMALHPNFSENNFVYLSYTYSSGDIVYNRISRFRYSGDNFGNEEVILDRIPGGRNHNGGRIAFGPDDKLWALTGDAGVPSLAQDRDNLAGKVLRLNDDGSVPEDNPFSGSPVFSFGHRNPQGLAWHPESGELFVSEHGSNAYDEVNIIQAGGNFGWPAESRCFAGSTQLIDPAVCSGPETYAPSGITFRQEGKEITLMVAGLRSRKIIQYDASDTQNILTKDDLFEEEFGRIRLVYNAGGDIYLITSNRDGRAVAGPDDDKLIRIFKSPETDETKQ